MTGVLREGTVEPDDLTSLHAPFGIEDPKERPLGRCHPLAGVSLARTFAPNLFRAANLAPLQQIVGLAEVAVDDGRDGGRAPNRPVVVGYGGDGLNWY